MSGAAPAATAAGGGAAKPAVSVTQAALALALLLGLQPVTTDLYLPALPALTRELNAGMSAAQLTMSALILAFGIAQLAWGPLADRFGRRPVLLAGLSAYTLASLGSVAAPTIEWLIACRIVQGVGVAASVVCARAIVRDLYEPVEGARVMSLGLSGLGALAIAAPVLGGAAAAFAGWRTALAIVAAAGAGTLAWIAWRLPETLAMRNPSATRLGPLLGGWRAIGSHPTFIAWTLLVASTYGGLFTLLSASSFVYIDVLGLSAAAYGAAMASGSAAYMLGTFVCRRWIVKRGIGPTVARGAAFSFAGGLGMLVPALVPLPPGWAALAVLVPQWLFLFGHGIHQPCGQAGSVGPFPRAAGAASALAGFVLALVAFGIGRWLGVALDGTVRPMALTVAFWALLTAAIGWTLVQRVAPRRPHGAR